MLSERQRLSGAGDAPVRAAAAALLLRPEQVAYFVRASDCAALTGQGDSIGYQHDDQSDIATCPTEAGPSGDWRRFCECSSQQVKDTRAAAYECAKAGQAQI